MSQAIRIARRLGGRARAFVADAKGLAALELALILPLALMLMSLVVFGGQAYGVQRRVTLAATTVANIFAQANNTNASIITEAQKDQILAYPNLVLYPYDGSTAAVVVSQLLVTTSNGTATGTVCGSWPNANGTARTVGSQLSLDPSIAAAFSGSSASNNPACGSIPANTVPTNYVVLGEVTYPFQPTGIWFSVGTMALHDSIIMIPRVASPITVQ
jgi:Flp pilus assembly protein TadG